ncbi:MAG: cupin domain-containing protein [Acidobacteriota bacterium]
MSQRSQPELEPARPTPVAETVSVQEGAIVSRTLARLAGGSLTTFAFDAGQGLSEHTSPKEAFVLVLDGELEIAIAGTPHMVRAGQIIRMPANVPHGLEARVPSRMLLVMFAA